MSNKMAERQAAEEREKRKRGKIIVKTDIQVFCHWGWAAPVDCAGHDRWNLELRFLITSLVLSKEKIGFLEISSVQSNYAKAAYVAALLPSLSLPG